MYKRPYFKPLLKRLEERRKFIQIISGARQVGKTTLIQQILKEINIPSLYISADALGSSHSAWLDQQWDLARLKLKLSKAGKGFILAIDEIQKIPNWTEKVKKFWEEDTTNRIPLKSVLLGSSPLLVKNGLKESLAGRFEVNYLPHWSFTEMKRCFNYGLKDYIFFGGYPGAAALLSEENRWKNYIRDSLIETTISKDILMMSRVDKPVLLRRVFEIGCAYSGQILSLNKILGQLQDAGNTTTITHYMELLSQAGMLTGIGKFSHQKIRQRASSPKFQVYDNSLITAQENYSFADAQSNPGIWGRLMESAVGTHLLHHLPMRDYGLFYFRDGNFEVDFILQKDHEIIALEVKSGRQMDRIPGMSRFTTSFKTAKSYLIGTGGISFEEFFTLNPLDLFR